MISETIACTEYFLPEDGAFAEAAFLALLKSPGVTYIEAFGFTLEPLFAAIVAADAIGVPVHVLIDHSQSTGRAEAPRVKQLVESLRNGDVTITTAGAGSKTPSQIWHSKAMVTLAEDGPPYCWEGSVNFSESGWLQGNTARLFRSQPWADAFIKQFEVHREWARRMEPQYQLTPEPVLPGLALPVPGAVACLPSAEGLVLPATARGTVLAVVPGGADR